MREKTPQDYAKELMKMYRENVAALSDSENNIALPTEQQATLTTPQFEDGTGGLLVNVTTLNRLYPVKNAFITVFTDIGDSVNEIETDTTDESGKSGIFNLRTPPVADSQQAENGGVLPYANYNISVKSDGYVEQIVKNIPVFSGVVSVQGIDLLPIASAGKNTQPQTSNQENRYNL